MRIAISGSTGLIGSRLIEHFKTQGHYLTRIIRETTLYNHGEPIARWDIKRGTIEAEKLEAHDCVIHLGGANISDKPWTEENKKVIYESRVDSTALLSQTLALLFRPPKVFFCASAVGFYGPQPGQVVLDESSPKGKGFLAQVCSQWEKATQAAQAGRIRVVNLRFGMVLSGKGGALAKMIPVFDLGLGGRIGSGKQVISWIALEEIPNIISHIIAHDQISGPVNIVSPNPVTNAEFTKSLGSVMQRPTFFPLPAMIVKMMFGEMGEELLLNGARAMPKRLLDSQYTFAYPEIKSALKVSLGDSLLHSPKS